MLDPELMADKKSLDRERRRGSGKEGQEHVLILVRSVLRSSSAMDVTLFAW